MIEYLDLLREVLRQGTPKEDRTGTGTLSVFGRQFRVDLNEGFPLLTTKALHTRSIVHELLWMVSGSTNVRDLQAHGVTIWDEWADENGELGPVYGAQWRAWALPGGGTFDQLAWLLSELKGNPDSRRLVISAWNVADLGKMALAPCHCLFQFNTRPMDIMERVALLERVDRDFDVGVIDPGSSSFDEQCERYMAACNEANIPSRFLDCQLYQRSADIFLGVPFNIASYALLLHLVARHVNMEPGEFIHSFGDLHLYRNHIEQAETQLTRRPKLMPQLVFAADAPTDLFEVRAEHFSFRGYDPAPSIKAPVAV